MKDTKQLIPGNKAIWLRHIRKWRSRREATRIPTAVCILEIHPHRIKVKVLEGTLRSKSRYVKVKYLEEKKSEGG